MLRAIAPTLPAVVATLVLRAVEGSPRSGVEVAAEAGVYVLVTVVATSFLERDLLREVFGYLRVRRAGPAVTTPPEARVV
jgi:hypothetical protein